MCAAPDFAPIAWRDGALEILDQTRLPLDEHWLRLTRVEEVADAIRRLAVRGAPAIGIAAAYGLALALLDAADPEPEPSARFERAFSCLLATRPTSPPAARSAPRARSSSPPERASSPTAMPAASPRPATAPRSASYARPGSAAASRSSTATRRGRCCRARG